MGEFLRHEPCPNCGSKDNVGVYSNGKWCFGCGYYIPGYKSWSLEDLRKQLDYMENKKKNAPIRLPADYRTDLSLPALEWLRKYQITDEEISKFQIGWSDGYERKDGTIAIWPSIILPAFDVWGNLLVYQRRTCGVQGFPKYHTSGAPEAVLWTVSPRDNPYATLIFVEDYISCLRVGRQFESSPLWGSSLSLGQITRVSDRYGELVLWLDRDKVAHAMKLRVKALPYFRQVVVIATEEDPKAYSDEQIRNILNENLGSVQ